MRVTTLFEILRYGGAGVGFYSASRTPSDPKAAFIELSTWTVASIAGWTGIEGCFFGREAAQASGYGAGSRYQRQSAFNMLALGLASIVAWWFDWGVFASAALVLVLLLFLAMSAVNHAASAWRDGNRSIRGLTRPVATAALIAAMWWYAAAALQTVSPAQAASTLNPPAALP